MESRRFLLLLYAIFFCLDKTIVCSTPDNTYLGNLRCVYQVAASDFDVLFQGQRIRCKEGNFLLSQPNSFPQIILLFIDPTQITVSNIKENTIWYLRTTTQAYQAFECKIVRHSSNSYTWDIRRVALPASFKDGESNVLIIPMNAIIIPLDPHHFVADKEQTILLANNWWRFDARAISLPTPVAVASDPTMLKQAITNANAASLNLRALHGAQQKVEFVQDLLHVAMFEPL